MSLSPSGIFVPAARSPVFGGESWNKVKKCVNQHVMVGNMWNFSKPFKFIKGIALQISRNNAVLPLSSLSLSDYEMHHYNRSMLKPVLTTQVTENTTNNINIEIEVNRVSLYNVTIENNINVITKTSMK